jgi:hypothetical protein
MLWSEPWGSCGFEQEGSLKKHYLKDGQFIDAKAYGLIG